MKAFLTLVAEDLLHRYGHDMRRVTVVFPSRRAASFLYQELSTLSPTPVWAPTCLTIGEVFARLSPYKEADKITSICQLYEQYIKHVGPQIVAEEGADALQTETLDRFWGWGEVMLADYDDVDKHMADAHSIFTLIHDTEELKTLDYLTHEQKEVLQRFLGYTIDRGTLLKRRFMRLWEKMDDIYNGLNEQQSATGLRYQGALYRNVCQQLKEGNGHTIARQWPHICFVGFNALNDVEHFLLNACRQHTDTHFYWDYDVYYTQNKQAEAGVFMQQNLRDFPSALGAEHFDNLRHLHDVTFIACSTDNAAARFTTQWLGGDTEKADRHNAVVLCNEHMVQPVMHAIPQREGLTTNVTMGFPLTETPIHSFIHALITLQTDGYDVRRRQFRPSALQLVQRHAYAAYLPQEVWNRFAAESHTQLLHYLQDVTRRLALLLTMQAEREKDDAPRDTKAQTSPIDSTPALHQLYIEAAYQTNRVLCEFIDVVEHDDKQLAMSLFTLRRLMRQVFAGISIPFHGDQTKGLQVMGVLETRCLDFRHLLMLSVEEDCLPKSIHEVTLIPPHIREAFGLTTAQHKVAIYSYYFYRLIQRAEHLTCVYNDNSVGIQHHEMSRFLRQLQAETDVQIVYKRLVSEPSITRDAAPTVPCTEAVQQRLRQRFTIGEQGKGSILSPTAINRFLRCPLMFYYQDVALLRLPRETHEGIDPSLMGNIFHDTAQAIYADIIRRQGHDQIDVDTLGTLLQDKSGGALRPYLDIVFDAHYFHPVDEKVRMAWIEEKVQQCYHPGIQYQGADIIIRDVLLSYLTYLLRHDQSHAPFRIIGMEQQTEFDMPITLPDGTITVRTGGRIDRIDQHDGTLRIVDYKTGRHADKVASVDDIFLRGSKHPGYFMQTCLYALSMYKESSQQQPLQAALLYPAQAVQADYDPTLALGKKRIDDIRDILPDFEEHLQQVVREIFTTPAFAPTTDANVCKYCDYRALCGSTL